MNTNPIYLALDLPRLDSAEALARKVAGHVGGLKLGLEFGFRLPGLHARAPAGRAARCVVGVFCCTGAQRRA